MPADDRGPLLEASAANFLSLVNLLRMMAGPPDHIKTSTDSKESPDKEMAEGDGFFQAKKHLTHQKDLALLRVLRFSRGTGGFAAARCKKAVDSSLNCRDLRVCHRGARASARRQKICTAIPAGFFAAVNKFFEENFPSCLNHVFLFAGMPLQTRVSTYVSFSPVCFPAKRGPGSQRNGGRCNAIEHEATFETDSKTMAN